MYTYPAREAKNSFSTLLEMAALGHEIRITKHGQEVAKLVSSTTQILKDAKSKISSRIAKPAMEEDASVYPDWAILNELVAVRSRVKPAVEALDTADAMTWQSARDDGRRA
jgi:prevent-host-death family protein